MPRRPSRSRSPTTQAASIALLLAGTTLSGAAGAQTRVQLERAPSGHLLLPVTLDGNEPLTFILDTGASHTAIAQPVAESLGFVSQWQSHNLVQSLNDRFEAERYTINSLVMTGVDPINVNSVIIPVPADHPLPVAGLLGADAIEAEQYEIDVEAGQLTLDSGPAGHRDGRIERRGLLIGEARLRRRSTRIHVLIDTGSSRTLINRHHLFDTGIRLNINARVTGIEDGDGEDAAPVLMRQLQIGGLCINLIPALQSDLDVFDGLGWASEPAMILGMDALQDTRIRVDRAAGVFEITGTTPETRCRRDRVQIPGL